MLATELTTPVASQPLSTPCCYVPRRYIFGGHAFLSMLLAYIIRVFLSVAIVPIAEQFGYDAQTSGILLSSFYWGYIVSQVPGGWLSRRYGYKFVMVIGLGGAAITTAILPHVVEWPSAFVAARVAAGLFEGVLYPSVYHLMSEWFPKREKGTIVAIVASGGTFGTVVSNGLSPIVVDYLGWSYLCYFSAFAVFLFLIPWLLLMRETPDSDNECAVIEVHPQERKYIMENREKQEDPPGLDEEEGLVKKKKKSNRVPWVAIIFHPAVLGLYSFAFATGWGWYVFLSWLPTYLKMELHFDLQQSGFIATVPYIIRPFINIGSGIIVDILVNNNIVSLTVTRKIFQAASAFLPATVLVIMSFTEPSPLMSSILVVTAIVAGAFDAGAVGNPLDLSPKYASIIFALKNTVSAAPGIVGVYLTGWILNVTDYDWRVVFLLAAGLYYASIISFGILGSGEMIDFDGIHEKRKKRKAERTPLIN